jgi:GR25 family glycosyltransferase involved in LPS biosynthesis
MKIYIKVFICLSALFILCILYNTVRIFKSRENDKGGVLEKFNTFYTQFHQLEKKLESLEPTSFQFPCPVYYINLDSDVDKNKFIQDQINYYKCNGFHRTSAIDARQGKPSYLKFRGNEYPIESNLNITNPEMGCLLSHIKTILTAYYAGDEYAIILEDDAYFKHARLWKTSIQDMMDKAPSDWNVLNLYSSTICCGDLFAKEQYVKHSSTNKCYLTSSYIINRQGMYNVLQSINFLGGGGIQLVNNEQGYSGADELIYKWAGNTYFVKPTTFFVYNDNEKMKTSIQSDVDLQNQLTNAQAVLNYYIK